MADEQGKQLKITIAVDNAALEQFKRAIREVTAEVSKLVETLNRAGGLLGGAGKGAVTASSRGGFSTQTGTTPGMQKPIGGALTAPAEQMAAGLRGMARGSVDALRQMESATRSTMERSAQNMKVFERALESLDKKYKNIRSSGMGGVALPGGGGYQPGGAPDPGAYAQRFGGLTSGNIVTRGGIDYDAGPRGRLGRIWDRLNSPIFGGGGAGGGGGDGDGVGSQGGGGKGPLNALRQGARMLGLPTAVGGVAGAVGAIAGLYSAGHTSMMSRDAFTAQETLDRQTDNLTRRSSMNSVLGSLGMGLRRDMVKRWAMSQVTAGDISAALGQTTMKAMLTKAYQESGNTGALGEVKAHYGDRIGDFLNDMTGNSKNQSQISESARDALLQRAMANIPKDQIEKLGQIVSMRENSLSLRDRTLIGEFQGNVGGRMSLMRQAGIGWGKKRGEEFATNLAERMGEGTAYTNEELAGMRATLGQVAGRGLMGGFGKGAGTGSLLAMQYGGLSNIAQIGAMGAQYGNGAGLVGALQGGVGTGGLDITAGTQIGSLVTSAMQQGNNSIGGSAAMQGLLSAAYTGTPGGDMRMARIMGSGVEGLGNIMSGGVDNLQKAINVLAANKAAPGLSVYGKHALQDVGPVQMMEMLRSGKVSPELAAMGVSPEMLKAYSSTQQQFAFSRFIGGTGEGGAMEKAAIGARDAGSASAYIRSQLKGLKAGSKEWFAARNQQASLLGMGLKAQGLVGSNEQGMGAVLAGLDSDLLPNLKGRGAHDVAAKTLEADTKRANDIPKTADEKAYGSDVGRKIQRVNQGTGAAVRAGEVLDAQGASGAPNFGAVNAALSEFTKVIRDAASHIKAGTVYVQPK